MGIIRKAVLIRKYTSIAIVQIIKEVLCVVTQKKEDKNAIVRSEATFLSRMLPQ